MTHLKGASKRCFKDLAKAQVAWTPGAQLSDELHEQLSRLTAPYPAVSQARALREAGFPVRRTRLYVPARSHYVAGEWHDAVCVGERALLIATELAAL